MNTTIERLTGWDEIVYTIGRHLRGMSVHKPLGELLSEKGLTDEDANNILGKVFDVLGRHLRGMSTGSVGNDSSLNDLLSELGNLVKGGGASDDRSIVELVSSVERVKMAIRMALVAKGVDVPEDAPLEDYPNKIAEITAPESYELRTGQNLRGHSFRIAPNVDASQCTSLDNLFAECGLLERVGTLDTRSCTSFYALFHTCLNLISVPTLDTSKGTNLSYMFYACRNLVSIPDMDTSKAVNISFMFSGCSNLRRLPLGNTSSVTNARYLANECSNLEEVGALDLGKVTDFARAFAFCTNLTSWSNQIDTHSAQSIDMMFAGCNRLASDIRIDCINVANAGSAFASCTSLTYIDVNQTPKLTFANSMFNGCAQLTTINGTLILNTLNIHNIFDGCTALQSVEIEQLKCSINLQESPNLSVESVLHLFNHAQEVTGQTINLHRSLEDKLEDEQIEIVVLKGWQVLFHG